MSPAAGASPRAPSRPTGRLGDRWPGAQAGAEQSTPACGPRSIRSALFGLRGEADRAERFARGESVGLSDRLAEGFVEGLGSKSIDGELEAWVGGRHASEHDNHARASRLGPGIFENIDRAGCGPALVPFIRIGPVPQVKACPDKTLVRARPDLLPISLIPIRLGHAKRFLVEFWPGGLPGGFR